LTGDRIVVVATGLSGRKSANAKTGEAIQVWILSDTVDPLRARQIGRDEAICGNCIHRQNRGGSCYVNVAQAPLSVYRAVKRGRYPKYNRKRHGELFRGRYVRFGAYGDPAAVPIGVLAEVAGLSSHWTGYAHQWETSSPEYARFCMASCETVEQRDRALAKGYRTFRVRLSMQEPLEPGEFVCPASAEAGKRLTCAECKACSGAKTSPRAASPAIIFHGAPTTTRRFHAEIAQLPGRISLL
jgi:hypothetical protein